MKLTGTTQQVIVEAEELVGNVLYLPGVYHSHNPEDALPGRKEVFVRTSDLTFISNDLTLALHAWREYCADVEVLDVKAVTTLD